LLQLLCHFLELCFELRFLFSRQGLLLELRFELRFTLRFLCVVIPSFATSF
jgi:hypothetical protein